MGCAVDPAAELAARQPKSGGCAGLSPTFDSDGYAVLLQSKDHRAWVEPIVAEALGILQNENRMEGKEIFSRIVFEQDKRGIDRTGINPFLVNIDKRALKSTGTIFLYTRREDLLAPLDAIVAQALEFLSSESSSGYAAGGKVSAQLEVVHRWPDPAATGYYRRDLHIDAKPEDFLRVVAPLSNAGESRPLLSMFGPLNDELTEMALGRESAQGLHGSLLDYPRESIDMPRTLSPGSLVIYTGYQRMQRAFQDAGKPDPKAIPRHRRATLLAFDEPPTPAVFVTVSIEMPRTQN